jgi:hypothetical protein
MQTCRSRPVRRRRRATEAKAWLEEAAGHPSVEAEQISLLCGYSHDTAGAGAPARFPSRLCALHTHVIPVEAGGDTRGPASARG